MFQQGLDGLYGTFVHWLVLIFLIIATITDIRSYKIPNWLNGTFFALRLAIIPIVGIGFDHVIGAVVAFIALFIPAFVKMQKMGGDIKCATVLGLYLGISLIPAHLLLASALLALYTLIQYVVFKKGGMLPFAPFFLSAHLILWGVYAVM